MTLESFINRTQVQIKDHAPSILAAIAAGGVVGTGLLAHKAGRKYERDLADAVYNDVGDVITLTGKEKFELGWKQHIPVFVIGGVTLTCIIASTAIGNRRNAALMGLVTVGEAAYREYREKAETALGKAKSAKVVGDIAQDRVNKTDNKEVVFLGDDKIIFFDTLTARYFTSTRAAIEKAENDTNRVILNDMYASQNEWYDRIGLDQVSEGDQVGWNNDHPLEVEFSATIKDDKPVFALSYREPPVLGFHRIG